MKKTILSIAIAAIFASCGTDKTTEQATAAQTITTADTAGYAQFKQWKERQDLIGSEETQQSFTTEGITESEPVVEAKPAPVIIYRDAPVKQQRVAKVSRPATRSIAKAPAPARSGSKRESYGRGTTGTEASSGSGTTVSNEGDVAVNEPTELPQPAKKEGWSKAAKGTAIGGASGAVIGAVLSKNKTKGAVIGGIVGAAGGYIFGRSKDKKDGRY